MVALPVPFLSIEPTLPVLPVTVKAPAVASEPRTSTTRPNSVESALSEPTVSEVSASTRILVVPFSRKTWPVVVLSPDLLCSAA